jgi:hypothetical protein
MARTAWMKASWVTAAAVGGPEGWGKIEVLITCVSFTTGHGMMGHELGVFQHAPAHRGSLTSPRAP